MHSCQDEMLQMEQRPPTGRAVAAERRRRHCPACKQPPLGCPQQTSITSHMRSTVLARPSVALLRLLPPLLLASSPRHCWAAPKSFRSAAPQRVSAHRPSPQLHSSAAADGGAAAPTPLPRRSLLLQAAVCSASGSSSAMAEGVHTYKWPRPSLTVDAVIVAAPEGGRGAQLLLIQARRNQLVDTIMGRRFSLLH